MEDQSIYEDSNILTKADKKLGNCFIEKNEVDDETYYTFVCLGREGIYEKSCVQYVLDEHTPTMLETLQINPETLREVVAAIHTQFQTSECKGLTGLLNWSSPEDDLWLYEGGNNANNVVELYGYLFSNYVFVPINRDDEKLMTFTVMSKLVEEYNRQLYCKPVVEVDAERYDEMLGCLPPERWENNVFYVSEAQIGDIHAMFCKIGDRYFEAHRDVNKTSNADFKRECLSYINNE